MAWIEQRGGAWRVVFRHGGTKRAFSVGEVAESAADAIRVASEELLRLLKRNVLQLPPGCTIEEFLQRGGKPSVALETAPAKLPISKAAESYLDAHRGKLEESTLASIQLHVKHLRRILGARRLLEELTTAELQRYVDTRRSEWIDPNVYRRKRRERDAAKPPRSNRKPPPDARDDKPRRHPSPATVRKEVVSLRTVWNWSRRHLQLKPEFPGEDLAYGKLEEPLPFMDWDEAERRVAAGDAPRRVWECLYLRLHDIQELLDHVRTHEAPAWVFPMFCFAAFTGARRSEMLRLAPSDVDLKTAVVTIREKKRDRKRLTTRRVPLSPQLQEVLSNWSQQRPRAKTFFCKASGKPISPREAHKYLQLVLSKSRWKVLRGWHIFRHSFISALASNGVDQRLIDEFVGHQTDEQRRRYRHLYPSVKEQAIAAVFGGRTKK